MWGRVVAEIPRWSLKPSEMANERLNSTIVRLLVKEDLLGGPVASFSSVDAGKNLTISVFWTSLCSP
jgi:hypothetical protein